MTRIVVDPITRIEGHLRIEAQTDSQGVITQASSSGTMIRGIEIILKGRDPRDAWAFTQRMCGVCTSSHSIASVRAVEDALQYPIPDNARIIRNLINGAQYVHDHVVHFYHLHSLDWVDILSAQNADPAVTAAIQRRISPNRTENNTTSYFAGVLSQLQSFIASGQLGIFTNGYWGHPAYRLPPAVNLLAWAHYLEALAWQRGVARLHAVFGGKNPHPNFVIGGIPGAFSANGETRLDPAGLTLVQSVIADMRTFVDQVFLPDTLLIASFYKDWATHGEGIGNFLTVGDFPLRPKCGNGNGNGNGNGTCGPGLAPDSLIDPNHLFIPRGAIINRKIHKVEPVDLNDPAQIQENVSHSWYDYSVGKDTPLHPYVGETTPNYTGPTPPYQNLDLNNSYSWIKSPRWRGNPMEVGPLARILMLLAAENPQAEKLVEDSLEVLGLKKSNLYSTLGRVLARTLESKIIADEMSAWFSELQSNINAGDVRTQNAALFDPSTWPAEARGAGFLEAPRGALAHWIVIKNGLIDNFQAVVPTTWNASPRDNLGIEGPYDASLKGQALFDPTRPLEILRTIHSFDPCMGCAVHLVDPEGKELIQVTVQ
jgi:hydrogenase large subunit